MVGLFIENIFVFFGINFSEKLLSTILYFINSSLEIFVLIFVIMTFVALLQSFIDKEKLRKKIENGRFGSPYIFATFLGIITPFCSCSSIPMFIGFLKSRIPLGVAISFLVTSPLVNEIVFVMLGTMFSWSIAIVYALLGITLGVITGIFIDKLKLEGHIKINFDEKVSCCDKEKSKKTQNINFSTFKNIKANLSGLEKFIPKKKKTFIQRIINSVKEAIKTMKSLYKIIFIGIGIGAIIHGYVPDQFIVDHLSNLGFLGVPLGTLLGVPMYASAATVVPIVAPLPGLGVTLGTTVAFMMSVAALSLPEALMLKKVLSWKLLSIFFGIVACGIIVIGYSIDFLF